MFRALNDWVHIQRMRVSEKMSAQLMVYHRTCCARGPLTLLIIIIDQVYFMYVADTCVMCMWLCVDLHASVPTCLV